MLHTMLISPENFWGRAAKHGRKTWLRLVAVNFQKNVMKLTWAKKLSVGNSIVDAEHRNLFSMVSSMAALIETGDYPAVAQEYELLESWLIVHFENEERIAQAVNFDFSRHKLMHQNLLKNLQSLTDELAAKNGAWSDGEVKSYFQFLHELLIEHIVNEDMNMKSALLCYPYDFKHTV